MSNYGPYGQPGQPQPWGRPPQPGAPPPYGAPGYGQPPYGAPGWGQQPPGPAWRRTEIPVVTMDALPGQEIAAVLGPVVGVVARPRELPPQARAGSMTEAYAAMLIGTRQDAVQQLVVMARTAGADAVVGLHFDSSEITQSLSEVVAYGTAVTLVPTAEPSSPATPAHANPWRPADQR